MRILQFSFSSSIFHYYVSLNFIYYINKYDYMNDYNIILLIVKKKNCIIYTKNYILTFTYL